MTKKRVQAPEKEEYVRPPRVVVPITLDTILAKVKRPETRAALEAARGKPKGAPEWKVANRAGWNDVRADTNDCLWLREQADVEATP